MSRIYIIYVHSSNSCMNLPVFSYVLAHKSIAYGIGGLDVSIAFHSTAIPFTFTSRDSSSLIIDWMSDHVWLYISRVSPRDALFTNVTHCSNFISMLFGSFDAFSTVSAKFFG